MKKIFLVLALLFGIACPGGGGQDTKQGAKPPTKPIITHVVRTKQRVTKNIIFLFDCSTSMGRNDRFKVAMREVNGILHMPTDEAMFSMFTFQSTLNEMSFWAGLKEKDDPKPPPTGWAKLPSLNAVKSANDFLNKVRCTSYTDIGSAIQKAFELNIHRDDLTIILFSDGNNTYPSFQGKKPSEVKILIDKLQKARTDRKKGKIGIFCFGVSAEQNVVMLSAIAKAGGGSYLTTDTICATCRVRKTDSPEVQRVHRSTHISSNHPDYDDDDDYDAPDLDLPDVR